MKTRAIQKCSFKLSFVAVSFLFLLSAPVVRAQIQDRPKPGPEQKKLEVFVGEWKYEGSVSDTPLGPGGKFAGKQTTRMVLDGLFLEGRAEDKGIYGGKEIVYKGVFIEWFDSITKTYVTHSYDNDGFAANGVTTVSGNTWASTGTQTDRKGKIYKTKSSSTFSSDGKTVIGKNELSTDDGKTWIPLYEITLTKVSK
ncbi:MAG: DUF1579 family protein [Verrucomicrobiota bacterium]